MEALRVSKPDSGADTFDSFYAAHFNRLMIQLYAYTADVSAAQDAVQEAFTRAWPRWDRLVTYDEPAAWVRRVALNVAANRWRRVQAARAHARHHREEAVDPPSPDRVALARALRTLPEKQRRAIVLFHIADLSIAAIATEEGVPEGTVKAWLHRGRAALATLLTDEEGRRG
ncbi:SigE family RNA polymerase sigma factor [Asanoa iriomotensis]|uniref:RNA polymerase sigma24 factor n=1 Tax=Asanoa iriomotensis TaxID=234613 RepID=A0ABQ4CE93_9ACTN|nr:SigE family RNA polymerase sigma factor [Asanoa iriomotensis]GIF61079.1 RNA polymerase sigma24 factor [Asanoa iriomotensis]